VPELKHLRTGALQARRRDGSHTKGRARSLPASAGLARVRCLWNTNASRRLIRDSFCSEDSFVRLDPDLADPALADG